MKAISHNTLSITLALLALMTLFTLFVLTHPLVPVLADEIIPIR